jgi:hypothetical protein
MLQCKSFSGLRQTRAMIRTLHSPQRPQWPQWPQCSFFKDILHIAVPAQNVSLQAFGSRLNSKSNSNRVNKSFPKARTEGVCFDMQKPKRSTTFTALRLNHKAKLPLHRHCQKWPGRLACRRMSSHVVACRRMSSHVVACRGLPHGRDAWPRLQGLLGLTAIEAHGLELQRAFLEPENGSSGSNGSKHEPKQIKKLPRPRHHTSHHKSSHQPQSTSVRCNVNSF